MGKIQILEKLSNKLKSAPTSEEDIVYILSRIRKIIEINDYPKRYRILNFYCNLAFHSRIDRCPKKVADMLKRILKGTTSSKRVFKSSTYSNSIVNFTDFHAQLQKFLKEYKLLDFYQNYKISDFNKILNEIYSDTPITLRMVECEIKVDANGGIRMAPTKQ